MIAENADAFNRGFLTGIVRVYEESPQGDRASIYGACYRVLELQGFTSIEDCRRLDLFRTEMQALAEIFLHGRSL